MRVNYHGRYVVIMWDNSWKLTDTEMEGWYFWKYGIGFRRWVIGIERTLINGYPICHWHLVLCNFEAMGIGG